MVWKDTLNEMFGAVEYCHLLLHVFLIPLLYSNKIFGGHFCLFLTVNVLVERHTRSIGHKRGCKTQDKSSAKHKLATLQLHGTRVLLFKSDLNGKVFVKFG